MPATASSDVDVFRAIADPTRRAVLDALRRRELPSGEIAAQFDMTMSAVSQHLRVLRDARLVKQRRVGRQQLYAIRPNALREVARWVRAYEGS